jgi:hypothetical protein
MTRDHRLRWQFLLAGAVIGYLIGWAVARLTIEEDSLGLGASLEAEVGLLVGLAAGLVASFVVAHWHRE